MLHPGAKPELDRLETRARVIRTKLRALPSAGWAKEATNRKRFKLAAQLHHVEAEIMAKRQSSLFPMNQRREG
jgi:hypothetical protein